MGISHKQQGGEKNQGKGGIRRGRRGRGTSIKTSQERGAGGPGITPDRDSGWTRCREQWASRLESRKGRGREATQSGQRDPRASGAKAIGTLVGPCEQGQPWGQCKGQSYKLRLAIPF